MYLSASRLGMPSDQLSQAPATVRPSCHDGLCFEVNKPNHKALGYNDEKQLIHLVLEDSLWGCRQTGTLGMFPDLDEVQEMTEAIVYSFHWSRWRGTSVDTHKGEMFILTDIMPGMASDQMQRKVLMSSFVNE